MRRLCLLACLAPPTILLFAIRRFYIRFPFTDDWRFISSLKASVNGEFGLREVWTPYHGHRWPFGFGTKMVLARVSDWNAAYEVSASFLVGLVIFGLLAWLMIRSVKAAGAPIPYILLPILSVISFSLSQHVNWMWGWQLALFQTTACVVLGTLLLVRPGLSYGRLLLIALLAALGSYASAAGVIFFGVVFLFLLAPLAMGERPKTGHLVLWLVATGIVVGSYIPASEGSLFAGARFMTPQHLPTWLVFIPVYIGSTLCTFKLNAAVFVGLCGLVFAIWSHYSLWRARRIPFAAVAPYSGFIVFVVVNALVTGLARATTKDQFSSPTYGSLFESAATRYTTFANLFWVAIIFLLYLMTLKEPLGKGWLWEKSWRRGAAWTAIGGIVILALLSGRQGYYNSEEFDAFFSPMVKELVVEDLGEVPLRLQYPYGALQPEDIRFLKEHSLSIYRPEAIEYWNQY